MMPDPRVRNYKGRRHLWERFQAMITRGEWPARLAQRMGATSPVEVRSYRFDLLPPSTPPLRISFASDFHAGPTTPREALDASFAALRASSPDVLLLGGDFICLDAKYIDRVAQHLGSIPAPLGCFAVLGNHDLWVDYRHIERRLEAAGIQLLTNSNVRLPAPFSDVWLCGLDDHGAGSPNPRAAFANADGVRIVLMHQPSGLLDIGEERFDVAFCGHTHGGQIALPNGLPVFAPEGRLSRRYIGGRYDLPGERCLIVSRGVGTSTLPLRAFTSPDIVTCTLATIEHQ
jgi:uncharacterized protein